ncbi:MAG: flagellar hook assembly protein FlgD [Myxococcota bacterium]
MAEVAQAPALAALYQTPADTTTAGSTALGQDAFLRLLTTQLQYQDPTSPMKNEDFIAQLAQFSSLEQLTSVNATLDGVYVALAAMNNSSMASLLGTDVIARGDQFAYSGDGDVSLPYNSPADAASATLTITDEDGTVVWSGDAGALSSGDGTVTWDGQDIDGQKVEAGTYTFAITAYDAAGTPIDVEERIAGRIDEMDYSTGSPRPSIDGVPVEIADILTLTEGGP